MSGAATASGGNGQPCHKDFECDEEEGTYVKFEFIEEDGDCYFEEETETGLITITDWESKEGDECEPISVEWESETHDATKVMAFGGDDCDTVENPGGSYTSGLENPGGNTAAISNLQFCVVPVEQEIVGTINLSYEDLPKDDPLLDWDVNDWVVDVIGTFKAAGKEDDGTPLVTEFTFDIVPQARGAGDDHEWHILLPSSVLCGSGSYDLTVKDSDGNEIGSKSDSSSFGGDSDVDITVFPSTEAVFDDLENAELPEDHDDDCTDPREWATLTVTFDDPCAIDVSEDESDVEVNGDNLFFDPYLNNLESPTEVHRGDVRLVVVPDDWQWPLGAVQIWDAYTDVDEGGDGEPEYTTSDWYETVADSNLVATCDFDPNDLDGS
ncbi:hypothetical protein [Halopenitus persicus]|uniref:hypothetical protein n=1 Tax=Halopenitus persicus TaxID=1048396 RepID=UPI000BBABD39|nr:hypothetical protein [Halopenitus persicus]